jgi:hypothetical protein
MTMENICVNCYSDINPSEEQICSSCRKEEIKKYEELIKNIEGSFDLLNKWVKHDTNLSQTLAYPALKGIQRFIKEFRSKNHGKL